MAPQNIEKTQNIGISEHKRPYLNTRAHLSYNADKNNNANFVGKIRKRKTKLNLLQTRDLALFGKSVLAKTLGASQLI